MAKRTQTSTYIQKSTKKRKGIHSKKRASKIKSSRNYKKRYRGQGR